MPSYSALFHTLTNRKHHCRLCGQIICSLPIKHPQRKVLCSSLFVVDSETRQIEEVGEGVDYGVKRRRTDSISGNQGRHIEEDKFLKGVRICRECRPILLWVQFLTMGLNPASYRLSGSNNIISKHVSPHRLPSFMRYFCSGIALIVYSLRGRILFVSNRI